MIRRLLQEGNACIMQGSQRSHRNEWFVQAVVHPLILMSRAQASVAGQIQTRIQRTMLLQQLTIGFAQRRGFIQHTVPSTQTPRTTFPQTNTRFGFYFAKLNAWARGDELVLAIRSQTPAGENI